jgi:hypothetical protein
VESWRTPAVDEVYLTVYVDGIRIKVGASRSLNGSASSGRVIATSGKCARVSDVSPG